MIRAVNINLDEGRRLEISTSQLDVTCLRTRCGINHEMHALKDKLRKIQSKTPSLEDAIHSARRRAHPNSAGAKARHDKPSYAMTENERKSHMRLERSRIKEELVAMLQSESTQNRCKGYGAKSAKHEVLLTRVVSEGDKKCKEEVQTPGTSGDCHIPVQRRRCKTAVPVFTPEVATVHRIKKVRQIAQVLGEIKTTDNRGRQNTAEILQVH